MDIDKIDSRLNAAETAISKIKELLADAKICNSEITKTLILSAMKKYSMALSDFKIEE